jgi:HECT-domain (ubiquitin-transferase)
LFENGFKWEKEILHSKSGDEVITKINWVKVKSPKAWKKALPLTQIKSLTLPKARTMLRSIEEKKAWFDHQCNLTRISYTEDSITLVIDRNNLFSDSFEQFRTTDSFDLHKEIKIFYVGEVALDAGGLMRQWVTDITKIIFGSQTSDQEGLQQSSGFPPLFK